MSWEVGGSAWESNPPPSPTPARDYGFEDRERHQPLSASGWILAHHTSPPRQSDCLGSAQSLTTSLVDGVGEVQRPAGPLIQDAQPKPLPPPQLAPGLKPAEVEVLWPAAAKVENCFSTLFSPHFGQDRSAAPSPILCRISKRWSQSWHWYSYKGMTHLLTHRPRTIFPHRAVGKGFLQKSSRISGPVPCYAASSKPC